MALSLASVKKPVLGPQKLRAILFRSIEKDEIEKSWILLATDQNIIKFILACLLKFWRKICLWYLRIVFNSFCWSSTCFVVFFQLTVSAHTNVGVKFAQDSPFFSVFLSKCPCEWSIRLSRCNKSWFQVFSLKNNE